MGVVEEVMCNASDLSSQMFCCVKHAFMTSLSMSHLTNRTAILSTMKHCFTSCHVSSHIDLFKEAMNIMYKNYDVNHEYNNTLTSFTTCTIDLHQRCTDPTKPLHAATMFVLVFMFLAALLGNLVVIVSILHTRSLRRSPSGRFILSLAFSDLLVTLLIIPLKLDIVSHNLIFCGGATLCRTYITIDNILFTASATNLFVLTVDRYIGLEYGFGFTYTRVMTKTRVKLLVAGIWGYAVAWGVAANINWSHNGTPPIVVMDNDLECKQTNRYYVTTVLVIVFYIPIVIMGFLYTKIFRIAHRHATVIDALHKNVKQDSFSKTRDSSLSAMSRLNLLKGSLDSPVSVRSVRSLTMPTALSASPAPKTRGLGPRDQRSRTQESQRTGTHSTIEQEAAEYSSQSPRRSWCNVRSYLNRFRCSVATSAMSDTSDNELSSQDDERDAPEMESLYKQKNNINNNNNNNKNNNSNNGNSYPLTPKTVRHRVKSHNSVVKATKTVAGICGCFLICWLPVTVLAIGAKHEAFSRISEVSHIVIVDLLPVLNSTVNPFIYSLINSTYRKAFRKAIRDAKIMLQMHVFK